MIAWKYKLWAGVGAAALTLAACSPAPPVAPEPPPPPAPSGEGGAAGEQGESGAARLYTNLVGDPSVAAHLQLLKGFVLIADRVAAAGDQNGATLLVAQGLAEAYVQATPKDFGAFDGAALRTAAQGGPNFAANLASLKSAINTAQAPLRVNHADLAARMLDFSSWTYRTVQQGNYADPIQYQHALGAALAARDALKAGEAAMKAAHADAYNDTSRELDRYIALMPGTIPGARPAAYRDLLAQASRVRLALSPFLDVTTSD